MMATPTMIISCYALAGAYRRGAQWLLDYYYARRAMIIAFDDVADGGLFFHWY